MENQLTEFVGLACYCAEQLGITDLPQRAIEKMVVVAVRAMDIHIENVDTWTYRYGDQSGLAAPGLVVEFPRVTLAALTSKLFDRRPDRSEGLRFGILPCQLAASFVTL